MAQLGLFSVVFALRIRDQDAAQARTTAEDTRKDAAVAEEGLVRVGAGDD